MLRCGGRRRIGVADKSATTRIHRRVAQAHHGQAGQLIEALHVPWLGVPPLDAYKLAQFCGRSRNPLAMRVCRSFTPRY